MSAHRIIKSVFVFAAIFGCLSLSNVECQAQSMGFQTLGQLKESPAGSKVVELINRINEESEVSEEVIRQLFAKELVDRIGVETLTDLFENIRSNDGQFELFDANRTGRFKYELMVRGTKHGEWLAIPVRFEEEEPFRIKAIDGVEFSREGPQAKEPMLTPKTAREFKRPTPVITEETIDRVEQWLNAQTEAGEFSGVVLLAKDYKPVYEKAFGLASKRFRVPNELGTKFRLASVNKIITATAILQLVEKGVLSLDDHLVDYIDGFKDDSVNEVTIRHLLTHSSGWAAYWEHPEYLRRKNELRSVSDYMEFIKGIELDFPPGERVQYSNTGYNVLGAVVEKVAGKSYYEYVQENIFAPLEMNSTRSFEIDHVVEGLATGYTNINHNHERVGKGYPFENTLLSSPKGTPAGGGCSTAGDLLKFVEGVAKHRILNQESVNFLRRDSGIRSQPSPFIFHNGGGPGQSAWMQADVENGYTLIVLCNLDSEAGEVAVKKIGELLNLPIWP